VPKFAKWKQYIETPNALLGNDLVIQHSYSANKLITTTGKSLSNF